MGIADRRERERLELKEKILVAARDLFAREGYDAVTMRRLAEKIEYSTTAIYLHFKDKESLLAELMGRDFAAFSAELARVARTADPIERMRRYGMAYVEFGLRHPNHYRLMFMTPRPPPHPDQIAETPQENGYIALRDAVREAIDRGLLRPPFRDPEAVAQLMWAAMHGLVSLEIVMPHPTQETRDKAIPWRPARRTAKLLLDALLAGVTR